MKSHLHIYILSLSIFALAAAFTYLAKIIIDLNTRADNAVQELYEFRKTIPLVLEESEKIRQDMPQYIESLNDIVSRVQDTGKQVGEGAVQGVVEGVVKTPFSFISSVFGAFGGRKESANLSEQEEKLIEEATLKLLKENQIGTQVSFLSTTSRFEGTVALLDINEQPTGRMYKTRIRASKNESELFDHTLLLEMGDGDQLMIIEDTKQ